MTVKWKDKVLGFEGKKLRFNEEIITAGAIRNWIAVCTPTKIYFYGDEHMVLTRPIKNAVIKRDGVYYHHKESNHIFLVSNPFEPEEFVFFRHGFFLKEIVSGVLILEKDGGYLLRSMGMRKSRPLATPGTSFKDENETNIVDGGFIEFNKTRMLRMCEIDGRIRCFIDDYSNESDKRCYDSVSIKIVEYDSFLVGMYKNTASLIKLGGSRGGVKRSKLPSEMSVTFSRDIEYFMKYRMKISKDVYLEFLRINETLFFGNEIVCNLIESDLWPRSRVSMAWNKDYYKPFWTGISKLERNIIACCPKSTQKEFIEAFLRFKEKRFDLLKPTKECMARIGKILERWLIKCNGVWEFLSLKFPPMDLPVISKCERLIKHTHPLPTDTEDILDVKYRRIMNYNAEAVKSMRYSEINNLAYKIIYLELRKSKLVGNVRPIKSMRKLCRAAERYFGDPRMEEVFSLFNEKPRVFEIDEHDLENKKERSYILRIAANIGKTYLFYGSGTAEEKYNLLPLKFLIYKNDELSEIEIKEAGWADWPSFNYSVYRGCSLELDDEIAHSFIETKVRNFISAEEGSEFVLAGNVFAFGLQNRLKSIHPQTIIRLVTAKYPVLSMALLAGAGISYMGKRDDALGKLYIYYLKSAQPMCIHVGSVLGLGLLYSGSSNVLIKEILITEANREGVFKYEAYNKGNKIWYDYTYKITASLSAAMLYIGTNLEMFKFIDLKDSLCELLANGVILFGTKQMKFMKKLRRSDSDRLEELFYSEFFLLGLALDGDLNEIVKDVREGYQKAKVCELYRISGKILYLAVYILYKNMPVDFGGYLFRAIVEMCLDAERLMRVGEEFKILFDTCLVSLSLISNSSCNLDVIRILRRQIKATERSKFLLDQIDFFFTTSRYKQEAQFTIRYGDIERYKICLGIVTCGMGSLKISNTPHLVLDVVATFFINFPISTLDQEYFNMFRYFLLLSMKKNPNCLGSSTRYLKLSNKNSLSTKNADMFNINKMFIKTFSEASSADKKFTIDVLTDFYEQHGGESTLLDIEVLKNLACRAI